MGRAQKKEFVEDARRFDRYPTDQDAEIDFDGTALPAKIRDVSNTGLRIEASSLPAAGSRIRVRALGLKVSGQVIWQNGRLCGIFLSQPIKALSVIWANRARSRGSRQSGLR